MKLNSVTKICLINFLHLQESLSSMAASVTTDHHFSKWWSVNFLKTDIYYPLIRKLTYAHQEVKNANLSGNFAYILNVWSLSESRGVSIWKLSTQFELKITKALIVYKYMYTLKIQNKKTRRLPGTKTYTGCLGLIKAKRKFFK